MRLSLICKDFGATLDFKLGPERSSYIYTVLTKKLVFNTIIIDRLDYSIIFQNILTFSKQKFKQREMAISVSVLFHLQEAITNETKRKICLHANMKPKSLKQKKVIIVHKNGEATFSKDMIKVKTNNIFLSRSEQMIPLKVKPA